MAFISFWFYIFLAVTVGLYYIIPVKFRWLVLLLASLGLTRRAPIHLMMLFNHNAVVACRARDYGTLCVPSTTDVHIIVARCARLTLYVVLPMQELGHSCKRSRDVSGYWRASLLVPDR